MREKVLGSFFILMVLLASCAPTDETTLKTNEPVIILSTFRGGGSLIQQILARNIDYAVNTNSNQVANPPGFNKWRAYMAWSHDGGWLAFDKPTQNGNNVIFITNWPDQSKLIQVTSDSSNNLYPSWSPGSDAIIYENYYGKIYGVEIRCLLLDQVCNPKPFFIAYGSLPVWSSDGKYIAYQGSRDHINDAGKIFLMRLLDGENTRRIISPEGENCYHPGWSPDGSRLTIECKKGIYVVKSDGTDMNLMVYGDMAKWSPDGKLIAFRGGESLDPNLGKTVGLSGFDAELSSNALFTIRPDGTEMKRITSENYQVVEQFFWEP
jgi:Tol biopolymer transport system component